MNKIRLIILPALILSLAAGLILRTEKAVDESIYLNEVAPDRVFGKKGGSPPHYASLGSSGEIAFNSYDVTPEIKGYAGPIKLLIAINREGIITGIRILEHKETPNYVHRMDKPEFLGQFLGKGINDPLEMDVDIDGITRATVSVKALTDTVRESSREAASGAMGLEIVKSKAKGKFSAGWVFYLLIFAAGAALYFITRHPRFSRRLQRARDAALLISIPLIGIYLSSPFSILHVLNMLLLRIPSNLLLSVVLISSLISALAAGRFYCGWLCPFGAASEFIGRIPLRKWEIPYAMDDRMRNVKYYLLGLVIVVVLISGKIGFGNFETYVTLFSFHGTVFTWSLVLLSLVLSLRVKRFWCRFLCPVAALLGLLTRDDKGYVSSPDCPIGNKSMPLTSECIRCNRCYKRN